VSEAQSTLVARGGTATADDVEGQVAVYHDELVRRDQTRPVVLALYAVY
jgi:hypothetical protein